MELPDSQRSLKVMKPVIIENQYHGMTELCVYAIDELGFARMGDHWLDGDPSCIVCGRCRVLDTYGRCTDCRQGYLQRHDDDPSIVRKDRDEPR